MSSSRRVLLVQLSLHRAVLCQSLRELRAEDNGLKSREPQEFLAHGRNDMVSGVRFFFMYAPCPSSRFFLFSCVPRVHPPDDSFFIMRAPCPSSRCVFLIMCAPCPSPDVLFFKHVCPVSILQIFCFSCMPRVPFPDAPPPPPKKKGFKCSVVLPQMYLPS